MQFITLMLYFFRGVTEPDNKRIIRKWIWSQFSCPYRQPGVGGGAAGRVRGAAPAHPGPRRGARHRATRETTLQRTQGCRPHRETIRF